MGSANLALGSKNDVNHSSAIIRYGTWGWSRPSGSSHTETSETEDSITTTTTTISYGSLSYSWSFSDGGEASSATGSHNFTGLQKGARNTCTARVNVSVKKTTTITTSTKPKPKPEPDPKPEKKQINKIIQGFSSTKGSSSSSTWISLGSASASITVYTRPGNWSWGFPVDPSHSYIVNYITVSRWNNLVNHLGKYQSWAQQSSNYNSYSYLNVSSGEWIGAKKYNSMAQACGISNRVVANKTLITAAAFKVLADAVST